MQADVRDIVTDVVEETLPAAQDKEIDPRLEELCDTVVTCNPGVVISMISDLAGNAVKYIGDAPVKRVSVRARNVGQSTRIEVQDSGPGVPRERSRSRTSGDGSRGPFRPMIGRLSHLRQVLTGRGR